MRRFAHASIFAVAIGSIHTFTLFSFLAHAAGARAVGAVTHARLSTCTGSVRTLVTFARAVGGTGAVIRTQFARLVAFARAILSGTRSLALFA